MREHMWKVGKGALLFSRLLLNLPTFCTIIVWENVAYFGEGEGKAVSRCIYVLGIHMYICLCVTEW